MKRVLRKSFFICPLDFGSQFLMFDAMEVRAGNRMGVSRAPQRYFTYPQVFFESRATTRPRSMRPATDNLASVRAGARIARVSPGPIIRRWIIRRIPIVIGVAPRIRISPTSEEDSAGVPRAITVTAKAAAIAVASAITVSPAKSMASAEAATTVTATATAKRQRAEGSHCGDDYDANHLFHIF